MSHSRLWRPAGFGSQNDPVNLDFKRAPPDLVNAGSQSLAISSLGACRSRMACEQYVYIYIKDI